MGGVLHTSNDAEKYVLEGVARRKEYGTTGGESWTIQVGGWGYLMPGVMSRCRKESHCMMAGGVHMRKRGGRTGRGAGREREGEI
eukprot:746238-Hanusia_phi.AAC.1